jgi:hypothetical protein
MSKNAVCKVFYHFTHGLTHRMTTPPSYLRKIRVTYYFRIALPPKYQQALNTHEFRQAIRRHKKSKNKI